MNAEVLVRVTSPPRKAGPVYGTIACVGQVVHYR
jgi:hypothetical protein